MPYETLEAEPYVKFQGYSFRDATSQVGNTSLHFKNFAEKGSSAINATFIPNNDFPFEDPVALSIEATVSNLVSINYPLGSKQTVILTFFGGQGAIWDNEFVQYTGFNKIEMIDYPFQIIIQFPTENYLSSDTSPAPTSLFVTEGFRSAIFDLNFTYLYPEWRGQSISCSFVSPQSQSHKDLLTFLSGIFLATGITLCIEFIKIKKNESERKGEPLPSLKEFRKKGRRTNRNAEIEMSMLSKKSYLMIILIVGLSIFIVADWIWIMPIARDIAVNLLTDAMFAMFTIVFLMWLIDYTENRQWKLVKDKVMQRIASNLQSIVSLITYFVDMKDMKRLEEITRSGTKISEKELMTACMHCINSLRRNAQKL